MTPTERPADSPAPFPAEVAQTGRLLTPREKRVGLSEKRVGLFRKRVGLFGKRVGLFSGRVRTDPPRVPQRRLRAGKMPKSDGKRAHTGAFWPPGTRFVAEGVVCALLYYIERRPERHPAAAPTTSPGVSHLASKDPLVAGSRPKQAGWHFRTFQLLFLDLSPHFGILILAIGIFPIVPLIFSKFFNVFLVCQACFLFFPTLVKIFIYFPYYVFHFYIRNRSFTI